MAEEKHLRILWTNADPETSKNMVFMYATNSMINGWWDRVTVIVWGSTQKALLEDEAIYQKFLMAKQVGVEFSACIACAVNLGLTDSLQKEGVELIRWGEPLTNMIQNHEYLLTI